MAFWNTKPAEPALSEARVATDQPRRYLSQLCKHFQHKLPVTLAETEGSITFGMGVCTLHVEEAALVMRCSSPDATRLDQLQDVVARHLVRFAFRDPPVVEWRPAG